MKKQTKSKWIEKRRGSHVIRVPLVLFSAMMLAVIGLTTMLWSAERGENPQLIRAAILAAAKNATDIGDRTEAIRTAVAALEPGDALLVAGKGHETGQIVGAKVLPFSDHDAVAAALASRVA